MKTVIMEHLKQAMRDKDTLKKGVLTILKAGLDSAEKDKGSALTNAEEIIVVRREIKQTQQALEASEKAERQDLIEKEKAKMAILEAYLPEQVSEEKATQLLVDAGVAQGMSMKDAMTIARKTLDGIIDNASIAKLVKQLIA